MVDKEQAIQAGQSGPMIQGRTPQIVPTAGYNATGYFTIRALALSKKFSGFVRALLILLISLIILRLIPVSTSCAESHREFKKTMPVLYEAKGLYDKKRPQPVVSLMNKNAKV